MAQEADPPDPFQMLQILYKSFTKRSNLEPRAPDGSRSFSGGRSARLFQKVDPPGSRSAKCWLAGCLAPKLASWLVGRPACWLAGWLVGWLVGWLAGCAGWLVAWGGCWLAGWLAGGLVGWHATSNSIITWISIGDTSCSDRNQLES